MQSLTPAQRDELADMQMRSAEVALVSSSPFSAVNKEYVDTQVSTADSRITAILADAGPAFDTLVELKNLLDSGDATLSTALATQIGVETTNRTDADVALGARIDAEKIVSADAVSAESARAVAVEDELKASIESEVSTLTALLEDVTGSLANEVVLRGEAVASVQSALTSEIGLREEETQSLRDTKFDQSDNYSKREDGNFSIAESAFLYIGSYWRIRANAGVANKRLEFEYSHDGTPENFKTAVPFIRGV
jgi:hypothetical protein